MNKIISIYNRIADIILSFQPLFAIPLYFTVLANDPPFWVSLIISLIPFVLRYQQQKITLKRTIFDFPICIFVVGSVVGYFMATNKDTATGALISLLASILIYYGITSNNDRGKKYWISFGGVIILIAIVFSVWFFSQGQSKQFFFNQWAFNLFKSVPKISKVSFGIHGIGALFSAVIPVLLGVLLFTGNKFYRIWMAVLTLILVLILFLSVSGGGWIACAVGIIFILICWRKRSLFFTIPLSGLLTGLALFFYNSSDWISASFSIETLMGRIDLWVQTIPLMYSYHAFFGLGLGNWAKIFNNYVYQNIKIQMHLHNNYLQLYADMGIFGVLAVSSAVVIFAITAYRILRSPANGIMKGLGIGFIGSFLGGAFFNMFDVTLNGAFFSKGSYIYLSIPLLWIWAGFYSVLYDKLITEKNKRILNF